jgi:hypothetical protein
VAAGPVGVESGGARVAPFAGPVAAEAESLCAAELPRVVLSVVMPAHNEQSTIERAVRSVLTVPCGFPLELIVVDDGSTDRTALLAEGVDDHRLIVLQTGSCRGKGAAVMLGASLATGTHLLVFDADLEYSARDIPALVQPVLDGTADVVYGARVPGIGTAFYSSRYKLGSDVTRLFTNVLFDAWLGDMHTCLKLLPLPLFRRLNLSEPGFGLDAEITGELLRRGVRPYEIPCSYRARSRAAGKKIGVRDGFECIRVVLQVRMRGRIDPVTPTVCRPGRRDGRTEAYRALRPAIARARPTYRRQPIAGQRSPAPGIGNFAGAGQRSRQRRRALRSRGDEPRAAGPIDPLGELVP